MLCRTYWTKKQIAKHSILDTKIIQALKLIDELRQIVRDLEDFKKITPGGEAIGKLIALKTAELDLQEKIVEFYKNRSSSS